MSTHKLCFEQKYENKYQIFYLKIFIFGRKFSVHLNRLGRLRIASKYIFNL